MSIIQGDLLLGAKAIGQFLGVTERQAQYLIEKGSLPHWRDGKRSLCARRSTLARWLDDQEREGRSAAPAKQPSAA